MRKLLTCSYISLLLPIIIVLFFGCRSFYLSNTDMEFVCSYVSEKNEDGIGIITIQRENKQHQTYASDGVLVKGFNIETDVDTIAHRHFTSADIEQIKKALGTWYSKKNNYEIYETRYEKIKEKQQGVFKLNAYEDNKCYVPIGFILLKFDNIFIVNTFTPEELATPEYQQIRADIIARLREYYVQKDVDKIMNYFDKGHYRWYRNRGRPMYE